MMEGNGRKSEQQGGGKLQQQQQRQQVIRGLKHPNVSDDEGMSRPQLSKQQILQESPRTGKQINTSEGLPGMVQPGPVASAEVLRFFQKKTSSQGQPLIIINVTPPHIFQFCNVFFAFSNPLGNF